MTQAIHSEICDGCGNSTVVIAAEGNEFCAECHALLEILQKKSNVITQLCRLTKTSLSPEVVTQTSSVIQEPRELPDVLDAVRYRTRDRDQNTWYVSISEMNGEPVEIFASTAFDRDQHLQSRISNLTTITRLVSLILRHVFLGEVLNLDKTLKQLHRSSRQKNDLPDMLTRVLSNYRKNQDSEAPDKSN